MKHIKYLALISSLFAILLLAGCFGENDTETSTEEIADATDETTDEVITIEEFGFVVDNTVCIKQLHGGCVSADYIPYESNIIGLKFLHPLSWVNVSAKETEVAFVPASDKENDPTKLFIWRSVASQIEPYRESTHKELTDSGEALMGPYDVTWEIYEGKLDGEKVKTEWVTLNLDPYNPWINFVVLLVTEPENFLADQDVLQGIVSSIALETPGVQ